MLTRRFLLLAAPLALCAAPPKTASADDATAAAGAVIRRFYDELLALMKEAKRLSFAERYTRIAPSVSRTFNLPLMSRIAVGPDWSRFNPEQQQRVADSFSRYTISVYASRFDDYGGERFEVEGAPAASANGLIVQTALVKSNGEKIALNYLMRQGGDGIWQVIDVFLSGTVSELAARRSEFSAALQRGGAEALVRLLEERTAALRTG